MKCEECTIDFNQCNEISGETKSATTYADQVQKQVDVTLRDFESVFTTRAVDLDRK